MNIPNNRLTGIGLALLGLAIYLYVFGFPVSLLNWIFFLLHIAAAIAAGYLYGYDKGTGIHWRKAGIVAGGFLAITAMTIYLVVQYDSTQRLQFIEILFPLISLILITLALQKRFQIIKNMNSIGGRLAYIGLFFIGILSPFIALGLALGYGVGYLATLKKDNETPRFTNIPFELGAMTLVGGILGLAFTAVIFPAILDTLSQISIWKTLDTVDRLFITGLYLLIGFGIAFGFYNWVRKQQLFAIESNRYGSARFAKDKDLKQYTMTPGVYIGGDHHAYSEPGHLLTVAGTRAGKGTNLIIPNLLGKGGYTGSWIVIDPKGQNAFLSHKWQSANGRIPIILNPWNKYLDTLGNPAHYNPLDLITPNSSDLWDDCLLIAETLVPVSFDSSKDAHWDDRARSLIALILANLSTKTDRPFTLESLWKALSPDQSKDGGLKGLFGEMATNNDPLNGMVIQRTANQFLELMQGSYREFTSILSVAQRHVSIVASPQIRTTTGKSDFKIQDLLDHKFALYIIIPPDKLLSHGKWLRLVITTLMRGIVRADGASHRITFLMDEFYSLGYLREIEVGLAQYAGYNISLWPILQSISQLQQLYPKSWGSFIDNSVVQHYFGINGKITMEHVSSVSGSQSYMTTNRLGFPDKVTKRQLLTPDEVRRGSRDKLFTFIDSKPLAEFAKLPYFDDPELADRYPDDIPSELK